MLYLRLVVACCLMSSAMGSLSGRSLLPTNKGCYSVKTAKKCCGSIDSRFTIDGGEFGGERCFPAKKKFASGTLCEPENWISEKSSRRVAAATCGDEGMVGVLMHKLDSMPKLGNFYSYIPSTYRMDSENVKIVLAIIGMMVPLVFFAEVVAFLNSVIVVPGSAMDDLAGKGVML